MPSDRCPAAQVVVNTPDSASFAIMSDVVRIRKVHTHFCLEAEMSEVFVPISGVFSETGCMHILDPDGRPEATPMASASFIMSSDEMF